MTSINSCALLLATILVVIAMFSTGVAAENNLRRSQSTSGVDKEATAALGKRALGDLLEDQDEELSSSGDELLEDEDEDEDRMEDEDEEISSEDEDEEQDQDPMEDDEVELGLDDDDEFGGEETFFPKQSCKKESKYLGVFDDVDQCIERAEADPGCSAGSLMYSDVYKSWGCRCCTNEGYNAHGSWDVYTFEAPEADELPPATHEMLTKPKHACKKESKYLGVFDDVDQCIERAEADPGCSAGSLMYSNAYKSWGCRCCTNGGYNAHGLWDVYNF